jgi:hypothetical protein
MRFTATKQELILELEAEIALFCMSSMSKGKWWYPID